jgi:hypothetical protein
MKLQSVRLNETLDEVDRMEKPGQINSLTTHESNGISNKLRRSVDALSPNQKNALNETLKRGDYTTQRAGMFASSYQTHPNPSNDHYPVNPKHSHINWTTLSSRS